MTKTKRALLYALADKIGGDFGSGLRASLKKNAPFDDALDRPLSDREFALQLANLERDFRAAIAKKKSIDLDTPGSWGFPN